VFENSCVQWQASSSGCSYHTLPTIILKTDKRFHVDGSRAHGVNPAAAEKPPGDAAHMAAGLAECQKQLKSAFDGFFQHDVFLDLHAPVYTCDQAKEFCGHRPGAAQMKNLFLKDKKKKLFLVSALVDTELKLGNLPFGKSPGFANTDALFQLMGLLPGSVSPFGLLNDSENAIEFHLDARALENHDYIAFHPNSCAATVTLHKDDFVRFMEDIAKHKVNIMKV